MPAFFFLTILTLFLSSFPSLANAYTWNYETIPKQCSTFTISVSGTGGKPPYRLVVAPVGGTPLPGNVDARRVIDQQFQGDSTSASITLTYPAMSQFVAVVSDATGFGSGGTSAIGIVTSSSDNSCFNPTTNASQAAWFALTPDVIAWQCVPTRIWWDKTTVSGTPNFLGIIPGGQSFPIPRSQITDLDGQGTGFAWTPSVRSGTTLIIVGGDDRGNGTAGSEMLVIGDGINGCINNSSPSSTPGSPAGGSYPTGSATVGPGGNSVTSGALFPTGTTRGVGARSTLNIGAIAGGAAGGVILLIALALLWFFYRHRARAHKERRERQVALFLGHELSPRNTTYKPTQYDQPGSFTSFDPTFASAYNEPHTDTALPRSSYFTRSRSGSPLLPSVSLPGSGTPLNPGHAKKGSRAPLMPVNVIEHEDAGPSELPGGAERVETVEIPPSYEKIRR